MSTPAGLTGQSERRRWGSPDEHQVRLARLADDGYTDPVTHCHNRQYLLEVLEPQIAISGQYGFPLSIVLAEIAKFRPFRFSLGDAIADQILEEMAGIIKSKLRATDLVVRYGDASFALLLLHANRYGADVVCKRLKRAIESHAFAGRGSDLVLLVNMGASHFEPPRDCGVGGLLAEAEEALESANHTGNGAIAIKGIHL